MNLAVAGNQRKVKKDRRSNDKDTGMFAFTFLTITSFPATHACWGYVRAQVDEAVDITSGTMNACVVSKILSI